MFLFVKTTGLQSGSRILLRLVPDAEHFIIADTSGSVEVRLRKRAAYPITYCRQYDDRFELGYGKYNKDHHDEYLKITVRQNGEITVERDAYCVLPLFYTHRQETLTISNQYHIVLRHAARLTPSRMGIQDILAPFSHFACPPLEEIHVLGERQILQWGKTGLRIRQPEPRSWFISDDAAPSDPRDFRHQLESALHYFAKTRLEDQTCAFEVSGGLDSATLPLFLHRKGLLPSLPMLACQLPHGRLTADQYERISVIARLTRAVLVAVPLDPSSDPPLSQFFDLNTYIPSYPELHLTTVQERQLNALQQANVQVVCRGIGGDELFENIVDEADAHASGDAERKRRQNSAKEPFLTDLFYEEYLATVPDKPLWPIPFHARSMLGAQIPQNNLYIERGMWPVSPFADPSLYQYCQGLAPYLRANKNMLRIYHNACKSPEIIYTPEKSDEFEDTVDQSFQSGVFDSLIYELSRNSQTKAMGYVDLEYFLQTYEMFKQSGKPKDFYRHIWMWLQAEVSLQHIRSVAAPTPPSSTGS